LNEVHSNEVLGRKRLLDSLFLFHWYKFKEPVARCCSSERAQQSGQSAKALDMLRVVETNPIGAKLTSLKALHNQSTAQSAIPALLPHIKIFNTAEGVFHP